MNQIFNYIAHFYGRYGSALCAISSQVLTSGSNFVTTIIVVRSAGLEEFGKYSICFLIIMVARNFLNGVVLVPMSTIGPKLRGKSYAPYRAFILFNSISYSFISSVIIYLAFIFIVMKAEIIWIGEVLLPFILANFAANMSDFYRRYFFVYEKPLRALIIDATRYTVQIISLFILIITGAFDLSAETALYTLLIGSAAGVLVGIPSYGQMRLSSRFARYVWPRHWNLIKWMTPNIALDAMQNAGIMLVGAAIFGEKAIGAVRAMQNLANTINLPFNAFQQTTPSIAAKILVTRGANALRTFLIRFSVMLIGFSVTITIIVLAFSDYLIEVFFGLSAEKYIMILVLFVAGNMLMTFRLPIMIAFQTVEQPKHIVKSNIISVIIALPAFLLLPYQVGILSLPIIRNLVVSSSMVYLIGLLLKNQSR